MKNNTIIIILLCIIFCAGGFIAGMKYQQSKAPSFGQFAGRFGGTGGQGRNGSGGTNRQGMRPVNGTILSADANSITVKLNDGSSLIVLINSKTTIGKAAEATAADLAVGTRVSAFVTQNQDGSMTATNVSINPIMRGFNGNGAPGQNPGQNPNPVQ